MIYNNKISYNKDYNNQGLLPSAKCRVLVKLYFRLGLSNKEILFFFFFLAHKHTVVISIRMLKRLCGKLRLFQRINHARLEEVASVVQTEIAGNGLITNKGPNALWHRDS